MSHSLVIACAVALAGFATSGRADAQSIWGIDGPSSTMTNTDGPPTSPPCAHPNGPVLGTLSAAPGGGTCPDLATFAAPPLPPHVGDITVDRINDVVWATDGFLVDAFSKSAPGTKLDSFANPLTFPLTGLGYQAPAVATAPPILWLTDGFHVAAVNPPASCGGTPTILTFGVNALGMTDCTDIDYDPCTNLLYECYSSGLLASQTLALGPGVLIPVAPALATCGFTPHFFGLAVDTATAGTMFVTDGLMVARLFCASGLIAFPPTYYAPSATCWPWAGTGVASGLGFDATPIPTCGSGCHPLGGAPPVLRAIGEAISPGLITFQVTGGRANAPTLFLVGPRSCPEWALKCACFACVRPAFIVVATTGGTGSTTLSVPLPGGYACLGLNACIQVLIPLPGTPGCFKVSNALFVQLAAP